MDFQVFYPEKAYPELFEDVMAYQVFPDSKTFADAVPLATPEEINSLYHKINQSDRHQVKEFVHHWFELPKGPENPLIESKAIVPHISFLWDQLLRDPDSANTISSLIPLPYPYVVPGGRFREIYYWDSYFTMLGLRESGRIDIIRDMIRNFAWQLDHIGHIPNGNRSYFLSRSQPPFFAMMVGLFAEMQGPDVYMEYLPQLLREYSFWMDGLESPEDRYRRIVKLGDHQYLNRYYDDDNSPRTESYAEDLKLYEETQGDKKELYRNLRAACESGWDFSSRWFAKENELSSIRTTSIIPVDLNSLLYMLEKTIAKGYRFHVMETEASEFEKRANRRAELINTFLWNDEAGIFSDLIMENKSFGIHSLAMMYPLFAGIASPYQAKRIIQFLSDHFLRPGGWVTTNEYTGQQWDAPNGWAPLQWITYIALKNYSAMDLAREGAMRWLTLNEQVYNRTGRMMEKYNVEDLSLDAGGGVYPVQDGFGWTNGVYLALSKELNLS